MKIIFPAYRLKWLVILLLSITCLTNSCKKELIDPHPKHAVSEPPIKTISYTQFLQKINLNKLGKLKSSFVAKKGMDRLMSLNVPETFSGFAIVTDSLKTFTINGKTSYVFPVQLSSSKAVIFQNLTIEESNNGTKAFVTSYQPTKKWIIDWRAGIAGKFDGEITFTKINLDDQPSPGLNSVRSPSNLSEGLKAKTYSSLSATKTDLLIESCETYTVYELEMYLCKSGTCTPYTTDCIYAGTSDAAGWKMMPNDYRICSYTYIYPGSGGGSSGGGGDGGGDGGGGSGTTPYVPPGYDPCNGNPPIPGNSVVVEKGGRLQIIRPPSDCDENPTPLIYDENEPFYLPYDFDLVLPSDWYDIENIYATTGLELTQQGLNNTDPIPEMYYKNGVKIDMNNATPLNGDRTILGFPRNYKYFWKQVVEQKPQMFSAFNRSEIKAGRAPIVDDQWIKYNPTHKAYKFEKLDHHHEGQGRYAFAIPRKVHQKWSSILHEFKTTGKISGVSGKLGKLSSRLSAFLSLFELFSSSPDAWVQWFSGHDQMGKIYRMPGDDIYFEITKKTEYKNAQGVVLRAIVTYNVYASYIYDPDEQRYMGVQKLGTFTEDIDVINKTSTDADFQRS